MKVQRTKRLPCGRPLPRAGAKPAPVSEEQIWKRLDAYCAEHGLNKSQSRNHIVEMAMTQDDHFTVAELVQKVRERFPSVGAATVYRNLPILVSAGVLRESLSGDKAQAVYEMQSQDHHDHIVCLDCEQILEFHETEIESLQQKLLKKLRFSEAQHRHVIYARCRYREKKLSESRARSISPARENSTHL